MNMYQKTGKWIPLFAAAVILACRILFPAAFQTLGDLLLDPVRSEEAASVYADWLEYAVPVFGGSAYDG